MSDAPTVWPKRRAELTAEQQAIFTDWYENFLGSLISKQFGWVDRFNHRYAARSARPGSVTLEIGAGNGSQLPFEQGLNAEYVALDFSEALAAQIAERDSSPRVVVGNCQDRLEFSDGYFDRVLAIHVLERLDDLPSALREVVFTVSNSRYFPFGVGALDLNLVIGIELEPLS